MAALSLSLSLDDVIKMPAKRKGIVILFILLVLGYMYFFFYLQPAIEKRGELSDNLETLNKQIESRQRLVQEIEAYKKDIAKLEENLKDALAKLPEQKDIPLLLTAISEAEMEAGLDNLLFKPSEPVAKDFYKELPVNIVVEGSYHDIALFFDRVSTLSRIVNITDIRIDHSKEKRQGNILTAKCLLKTYMFMEPQEVQKQEEDKAKDEAQQEKNG
ncbi:MAG: type 4a pilus biogenesis protein PilO [Deltaproteobacteria bacterium]|nr:type 4a pilus biogenesis protein PilO [Deltaproteobacteria bacterium]